MNTKTNLTTMMIKKKGEYEDGYDDENTGDGTTYEDENANGDDNDVFE